MFRIIPSFRYLVNDTTTITPLKIFSNSYQTEFPACQKKWKKKRPKEVNVNPALLSMDKPVSGSLEFGEDLAEVHSIQYEFDPTSLNKRGFLRFQKSYNAHPNAIEQFLSLVRSTDPKLAKMSDTDLADYKLNTNPQFKFQLLSNAFKKFQHGVPNSMLYMIETVRDACKFYNTNVSTNTPYDNLQQLKDLPKNVSIQKEALRFDPETDTKFGGVSAFPKSSTIVTGIRAKKKYKTIHAKRTYIGIESN